MLIFTPFRLMFLGTVLVFVSAEAAVFALDRESTVWFVFSLALAGVGFVQHLTKFGDLSRSGDKLLANSWYLASFFVIVGLACAIFEVPQTGVLYVRIFTVIGILILAAGVIIRTLRPSSVN